jgi:hypothetical protein
VLFGLVTAAWLIALNSGGPARAAAVAAMRFWEPHWLIPGLIIIATFLLLARLAKRWDAPQLIGGVIALTVADLAVIGWTLDVPFRYRSAAEILGPLAADGWVDQVRASNQRLWVVTPRENPEQTPGQYIDPLQKKVANTNMLVHVRSATDYGPLQPLVYDAMFPHKPWGETVEIDPQPRLDNLRWRRPLNIGWLLLCQEDLVAPAGCTLVTSTPDGYRLYRNHDAAGMAFMDDPAHPGIVTLFEHDSARFTTRVSPWPPALPAPKHATSPRVVVSRLALPGWSAWLGDQRLKVEPALGGLMSVTLPSFETAVIEWQYTTPGLKLGASVTLMAAVGLLLLSWPRRPRKAPA